MITIRQLHGSEIGILEQFCLRQELFYKASNDDSNIAILDGQSIIGFSTVNSIELDIALIKSIYVMREYRGEGLGDALFRSTLHHLSTVGFRTIYIESAEAIEVFLEKRKLGLILDSNINSNINSRVYKCDISILLKSKCGA